MMGNFILPVQLIELPISHVLFKVIMGPEFNEDS